VGGAVGANGSQPPLSNVEGVESIIQKYMPPQTQAEKTIIKDITKKLKKTFWNYYKDHKTDMIEEQSMSGSYFRDEHGFESSGESSDGSGDEKK
jgi:hypothetical protein